MAGTPPVFCQGVRKLLIARELSKDSFFKRAQEHEKGRSILSRFSQESAEGDADALGIENSHGSRDLPVHRLGRTNLGEDNMQHVIRGSHLLSIRL